MGMPVFKYVEEIRADFYIPVDDGEYYALVSPRKFLLRYVPALIKRRKNKRKLFKKLDIPHDIDSQDDRREALKHLRNLVCIEKSDLESLL